MATVEYRTGYPVRIALPVQWGDMDAFGHVNNARYFLWFESARIAYLGRIFKSPMERDQAQGPILASTRCDYRAPLAYPDTLEVSIGVSRVGEKSFTMQLRVESAARGLAAEGEAVMVWYDYDAGRTVALPEPVRAGIAALEIIPPSPEPGRP